MPSGSPRSAAYSASTSAEVKRLLENLGVTDVAGEPVEEAVVTEPAAADYQVTVRGDLVRLAWPGFSLLSAMRLRAGDAALILRTPAASSKGR
jgi:hypothetical protein